MSPGITRAALLLAGAGAILILLGLLGTAGDLAGLAAIILGTVLVAPAGRAPGGGWWNMLASGAVLSIVGAVMSLASEGIGGLLALLGGAAVITGAAWGFPAGSSGRAR